MMSNKQQDKIRIQLDGPELKLLVREIEARDLRPTELIRNLINSAIDGKVAYWSTQ